MISFEKYLRNQGYEAYCLEYVGDDLVKVGVRGFSTVVSGALTRCYEKNGVIINYGLKESGIPPHLLIPWSQISYRGYTKEWLSDDAIMVRVEMTFPHEEIEEALINNREFVYNYETNKINIEYENVL